MQSSDIAGTSSLPIFSVASVFSKTYATFIAYPLLFTIFCAVGTLPFLFNISIPGYWTTAHLAVGIAGNFAHNSICLGAAAYAVLQIRKGKRPELASAIGQGLSRLASIVVFVFAFQAYSRLLSMAMQLVLDGSSIFFLLAIIIAKTIITVYSWVVIPVCVAEKLGPIASLRRSVSLTHKHRWQVLGLYLLDLFVSIFIWWFCLARGNIESTKAGILYYVLGRVPEAFFCVMRATLYLDLREAKEGPIGNTSIDVFN